MRRHSIIARLGPADTASLNINEPASLVTQIRFVDGERRLGFGLGQVIDGLGKRDVVPSERAIDLALLSAAVTAAQDARREKENADREAAAAQQARTAAEADKVKAQEDAQAKELVWRNWNRKQSPPPSVAIPIGDYNQKIKSMDRWWNLPQHVVQEAETYARRSQPGVIATEVAP